MNAVAGPLRVVPGNVDDARHRCPLLSAGIDSDDRLTELPPRFRPGSMR